MAYLVRECALAAMMALKWYDEHPPFAEENQGHWPEDALIDP